MVAGRIPIKTPEGLDELATRQRRVSQRHRTVLFLIDGKRDAPTVRAMALRAGVPEACFDELLATGLITWTESPASLPAEPGPRPADVLHVELPLHAPGAAADLELPLAGDSVLPPSRTLYPSLSADSTLGESIVPDAWLASGADGAGALDPASAEARLVLLRAVRAEAPIAGSLTLLRLRRARSRAELVALLDEVEQRITRPHRLLAAGQTMRRARQLLGIDADSALTPA